MSRRTLEFIPLTHPLEPTSAVVVGPTTPPSELRVNESVVPRDEVALYAEAFKDEAVAPELLAAEGRHGESCVIHEWTLSDRSEERRMRRESPAAHRNAQPIALALRAVLPDVGRVLEVPCGSGVHSAKLSAAFPNLDWLPADLDPEALASTTLWLDEGSARLQAPQHLDVTQLPWKLDPVDVVLAVNLIHAAPPQVTPGLVRGAAMALNPGGVLVLYGPFRESGELCASNIAFEINYLQQTDPRWGVRELDDVTALAATVGLIRESRIEMPANNLLVVFRRRDVSTTSDVG